MIGVECLSNIVNWEDRGTCILFGDGAGAAVVSADEDGNIDGRGNIEIPSVLHSDGSRGEVLTCQNPTGKRADGSLKVMWRWMAERFTSLQPDRFLL